MAARKSLGNNTVTYNSQNITQYLTSAELSFGGEKVDITNLANTAKAFSSGDGEWKLDVNGWWDNAIDAILGPDAVTPGTKRTLAYAVVGTSATVTYTWTTNAEVGDFKISPKTGEHMPFTASFYLSGAPTRASA